MRPCHFLLFTAVVVACSSEDTAVQRPGPYDAVPVSSRVTIARLHGPVDVVRDTYGMVHIHAGDFEDALRVQGYQIARDRTVQLELIRRSATGRLAELLGDNFPALVDSDISMRMIGLSRVAEKMLAQLPAEQ